MSTIAHLAVVLLILAFIIAGACILWWGFKRLWAFIPADFEPAKSIVYVIIVVFVALAALFILYDLILGSGAGVMHGGILGNN